MIKTAIRPTFTFEPFLLILANVSLHDSSPPGVPCKILMMHISCCQSFLTFLFSACFLLPSFVQIKKNSFEKHGAAEVTVGKI